MAVKEKGFTNSNKGEDRGVYIPPSERAPYCPQYMHMKKADVVAAEKKRRENDLKMKEYRAQLEAEQAAKSAPEPEPEAKKETPKVEAKVEPKKKAGRPKAVK